MVSRAPARASAGMRRPGREARAPLSRRAIGLVAGLAALNLVGALGGALVRVGSLGAASAGPSGPAAVGAHGALMMAGFFGSLIALERAVALRRGLWVPLLCAVGGAMAWLGPSLSALAGGGGGSDAWRVLAHLAWLAAAVGLVGLYGVAAWQRAASLPLAVEASGAVALVVGNGAALAGAIDLARLAWSTFLVLTIAGERRELMRMVRLPRWSARSFEAGWALFGLALALQGLGAALAAHRLWWALLGGLALWLLRFDLAPRQWRAAGWAGHTAICLSVGYVWLALAAVLGLAGATVAWHVLWLGFVIAMVFGHAPILLPALAGVRPRPTRWALLPLVLMGASVALRVAVDLEAPPSGWTIFGLAIGWPLVGAAHVAGLLAFAAVMVTAVMATAVGHGQGGSGGRG